MGTPLQARDLFLQAARAQARNSKVIDARLIYQRATESDPTYAPGWIEWGLFKEWQGSAEKAQECFPKAAQLDPLCYKQWADFQARCASLEQACETLHDAHMAEK